MVLANPTDGGPGGPDRTYVATNCSTNTSKCPVKAYAYCAPPGPSSDGGDLGGYDNYDFAMDVDANNHVTGTASVGCDGTGFCFCSWSVSGTFTP